MLNFTLAAVLLAALGPAASYERVLVPLFLPGSEQGAHDTRWRTDLSIRNTGNEPVTIFQSGCAYDCSCVVAAPCTAGEPTRAGRRFEGRLRDDAVIPGIMMHLERANAGNVAMSLRLSELTRSNHAGIEIPIVREKDLFSGPFSIVGVPARRDFRHHARIYVTSSPSGVALVRITATREIDGTRFYDQVHAVTEPPLAGGIPRADDLNGSYPGYLFAPIAGPQSSLETPFVLEVTPLTPGIKLWGMVSITHNESQLVTVMTPQ